MESFRSVSHVSWKKLSEDCQKAWNDYVFSKTTIIVFSLFLLLIATPVTASAQNVQDMGLETELGSMFGMFKGLADLFIKIAYGLMIIIFAVGMVKSGLTAQAAQQFGASSRVSNEIMNVIGGLVIFVFGMLSFPLVSKIIDSVVTGSQIASNMSTSTIVLPGIGQ